MTREQAKREVDLLDFYLQNHTDDYGEASHTAMMMAIKALEQQTCEDVVSRHAVEDKLLKLCNELEGIFANIRMENQDESVCGLCEYDCPAPFECKGFYVEDCFKLADEIRHNWQSTKDLPPVSPQPKTGHWIYDDIANNWRCDKCGETPKTMGYVGTDKFMTEHFKFCNHCGARMVEPQESEE